MLVVDPAAIVTEAATVSSALLLDRVTEAPPVGAACESVTVQVEVELLPRLVGLHESALTTVGASAMLVCLETPFNVAVTVAVWLLEIDPAVAVKVLLVAPADTVTDAGTVSDALLLDNATAAPPPGAA